MTRKRERKRTETKTPEEMLERAAAPSRQQIRRDMERVESKRLVPLLERLLERLFDPDLNVGSLKRACGIRDNSIAILFHAEVGISPKSYIQERRLETASRLLIETDLRVWQIGELTGYSSLGVFSKAFNRWCGQRPKAYRKSRQRPSAVVSVGEGLLPPLLERGIEGLSLEQAKELLEKLIQLYPEAARAVLRQQ